MGRAIAGWFIVFGMLSVFPVNAQQPDDSWRREHAEQKWQLARELEINAADVSPAQEQVDILYYGLNMRLYPDLFQLEGKTEVLARVLASEFEKLELNFGTHMQVDSVLWDGVKISFSHSNEKLIIPFSSANIGDIIQVDIFYQGNPAAGRYNAFAWDNRYGKPHVWTLSEPFGARDWWPSKDTPMDKADSLDLWIEVPDPLKVGSNGTLVSTNEIADGWREFHWRERYPIATYLVSLAVFDYNIHTEYFRYTATDSMPVVYYVYPAHDYLISGDYTVTVPALEVFSDLFGLYPFIDEKYGHAEFGRGGGMEHQTLSSMGGSGAPLSVHELAHQWWGNMVTCADFHHIWLNEGFATYSEALYWEATIGKDLYFEDMALNAYRGPGSIYVENLSQRSRIFDYDLSYRKASWVLHMLRHVVGDDAFFQILRSYYADQRFQYGAATTEDFQQVAESVYGKSLSWFFTQWIYGTWYPEYRYYWTSAPVDDQWQLILTIEQQTKADELFKMPLDVLVTLPTGDTTFVVWDRLALQQFTFLLPALPGDVQLDPEKWVLRDVTRSRKSIDEPALYPNYPNPLSNVTGTTITFQTIGEDRVSVHIYNILGQRVKTLLDQNLPADLYQFRWNGDNEQGHAVAAGIYFVEFKSGQYRKTRKMILIP